MQNIGVIYTRMMIVRGSTRERMVGELAAVAAAIADLEQQQRRDPGSVIEGWLSTANPRGTAGKPSQRRAYWVVRAYAPMTAWGGKKSRYLPVGNPGLVDAYRVATAAGQQLRKLRRQRDRLQSRLIS